MAIADAACDVLSDEGAAALSVRRVARAAGVSAGRVQHYFPDRESLMLGAFDRVQEQTAQAVQAAVGSDPDPRLALEGILGALIPADAASLKRLRVMAQFETLSLAERPLAQRLRDGHAELRRLLTALATSSIGESRGDGEQIAESLLATAEGLSGQVLLGRTTPERAREVLRRSLERVMPEERG